MKESEAKTKWCPFSRLAAFGASGGWNRRDDGLIAAGNHCIGSACMAWRWDLIDTFDGDGSYEPSDTDGSCGLARKESDA